MDSILFDGAIDNGSLCGKSWGGLDDGGRVGNVDEGFGGLNQTKLLIDQKLLLVWQR